MELLSPAGNLQKLSYAYAYGADAAYIGLKKFSLRVKADNFYEDEYKGVIELKKRYPGKRLHCALNISFHDEEIDALEQSIEYFRQYPIDAFIVQDLGIVPLLQREFPGAELHLSTQSSCVNSQAVKMYKSLGFSRIVLGREISLDQIRRIKDTVPEMELEAFAHGAMCIAYAGRCLMSAYLTGRSAQSGFCSHTCRWDYDLFAEGHSLTAEEAKALAEGGELAIREKKRPDDYFPIFEGDNFTAILSSKDLRMVEHLKEMRDAGIDSLKIEGRMKSVYYVAMVTRAYRKALDALEGKISSGEAQAFIDELENVSHRESTTGFYFNRADADKTTIGASDSKYELMAEIGDEITGAALDKILEAGQQSCSSLTEELNNMHPAARAARLKDLEEHPDKRLVALEKKEGWHLYKFTPLNLLRSSQEIQFISPEFVSLTASQEDYELINPQTGTKMSWVCDGHECVIYTRHRLPASTLLRTLDPDYEEGKIRDTGR